MQFDVRLNARSDAEDVPFLLELQSDHAGLIAVRVVAPLMRPEVFKRVVPMHPEVTVLGRTLLLVTNELFAIEARRLGPVVANLELERRHIIGALDFLFTGV